MTDISIAPSVLAFTGAAISGAMLKIAQAIPSTPNWLEHGALALLITLLIYGIHTLWRRNKELGDRVERITDQFHAEVKEEMQAQINAERESRQQQADALGELSNVLAELKKKLTSD